MRAASRPWIFMEPLVGTMIRDNNFKIVLLPARLGPMIPITSPFLILKLTFLRAQNSWASFAFFSFSRVALVKRNGMESRKELNFSPFRYFFETFVNSIALDI